MVSCIVPGCKNYSEKTGKTVSYHKIPKDHRTNAWLKRIRRLDMPPLENCHVCSDHFLPSCFEIDFRAQLMGQKGKADLKDDAIPSVFSYSYGPKPKMPRLSSELRLQEQRHREVSALLITYCLLLRRRFKLYKNNFVGFADPVCFRATVCLRPNSAAHSR